MYVLSVFPFNALEPQLSNEFRSPIGMIPLYFVHVPATPFDTIYAHAQDPPSTHAGILEEGNRSSTIAFNFFIGTGFVQNSSIPLEKASSWALRDARPVSAIMVVGSTDSFRSNSRISRAEDMPSMTGIEISEKRKVKLRYLGRGRGPPHTHEHHIKMTHIFLVCFESLQTICSRNAFAVNLLHVREEKLPLVVRLTVGECFLASKNPP